jgi:hypothetical protein
MVGKQEDGGGEMPERCQHARGQQRVNVKVNAVVGYRKETPTQFRVQGLGFRSLELGAIAKIRQPSWGLSQRHGNRAEGQSHARTQQEGGAQGQGRAWE